MNRELNASKQKGHVQLVLAGEIVEELSILREVGNARYPPVDGVNDRRG